MVSTDSLANEVESGFNKHKATIAHLYLAEDRTLEEVRDIMSKRHHFVASTKMYKTRFKRWGWRKNIRFDQPLLLLHETQSSPIHIPVPMPPPNTAKNKNNSTLDITTSLIVHRDRLEAYMRRRERRARERLRNETPAPVAIRLPDRFRASETTLFHIQQYAVRRYTGKIATTETFSNIWSTYVEQALFSWERFAYAVAEALETPDRFQDVLVLMRRAPEELARMLRSEPIVPTSDLCVFIMYLTHPRLCQDAQQRKEILKVIRALLKVATNLFDWPPDHPLLGTFHGLMNAHDEDLYALAEQGWRMGGTTTDIFLANLGPSDQSSQVCALKPVSGTAPTELICLVDETVRRARGGYRTPKPWYLDSLYHWPEGVKPTPPPAADATGAPRTPEPALDGPHSPLDEIVANVCRTFCAYKPSGGTKILAIRTMFDAHSAYAPHDIVQRRLAEKYMRASILIAHDTFGPQDPLVQTYLTELEDALRSWGEMERAEAVVSWREELLGPGHQASSFVEVEADDEERCGACELYGVCVRHCDQSGVVPLQDGGLTRQTGVGPS